jgi:hypothetical protein
MKSINPHKTSAFSIIRMSYSRLWSISNPLMGLVVINVSQLILSIILASPQRHRAFMRKRTSIRLARFTISFECPTRFETLTRIVNLVRSNEALLTCGHRGNVESEQATAYHRNGRENINLLTDKVVHRIRSSRGKCKIGNPNTATSKSRDGLRELLTLPTVIILTVIV